MTPLQYFLMTSHGRDDTRGPTTEYETMFPGQVSAQGGPGWRPDDSTQPDAALRNVRSPNRWGWGSGWPSREQLTSGAGSLIGSLLGPAGQAIGAGVGGYAGGMNASKAAGTAAGTAIGTALMPGIGAMVGGWLGGKLGDQIGSGTGTIDYSVPTSLEDERAIHGTSAPITRPASPASRASAIDWYQPTSIAGPAMYANPAGPAGMPWNELQQIRTSELGGGPGWSPTGYNRTAASPVPYAESVSDLQTIRATPTQTTTPSAPRVVSAPTRADTERYDEWRQNEPYAGYEPGDPWA